MFGTSIHWTTFFYLLIDIFILWVAYTQSNKLKHKNLKRFLILASLFVLYNLTGGFLPINHFPGPFILQYVITYGVAMTMGIYLFYYIYEEYDIEFLNVHLTISNIAIYGVLCFFGLYLLPYYFTNSIDIARICFAVPVSGICLYFLYSFRRKISESVNPGILAKRRNMLALSSVTCMCLLPILTVIGDYQWLTFTIINLSFYAITVIEIERYHYFLEHKRQLKGVFEHYSRTHKQTVDLKFLKKGLTRREVEMAMSILDNRTYKDIGEDFFIAERTVSKHASNIFRKIGVKNKTEFLDRFGQN